jgi:hypothetical protein
VPAVASFTEHIKQPPAEKAKLLEAMIRSLQSMISVTRADLSGVTILLELISRSKRINQRLGRWAFENADSTAVTTPAVGNPTKTGKFAFAADCCIVI